MRPEKRPAGAFGKHAAVARDRTERSARDRERDRIRDILMVEYSLDELQTIAANMRREAERRDEIAEMFVELGGADRVEHAFYETYLSRLAKQRENRRWRSGKKKSAALLDTLRRRARAYYKRMIADPVRRAARRAADRRRYLRHKSTPELLERMRARMRANKAKTPKAQRSAAWRIWFHRNRRERTDAYLRWLEKQRAKWRDAKARGDEEWLNKRRKAAREYQRRRRAKLRRDPVAYRAELDRRRAWRDGRARADGRERAHCRNRYQLRNHAEVAE